MNFETLLFEQTKYAEPQKSIPKKSNHKRFMVVDGLLCEVSQ